MASICSPTPTFMEGTTLTILFESKEELDEEDVEQGTGDSKISS